MILRIWVIIEVALAHVDKNKTRQDYNKAEYLDPRREMMCWWSDYIQQATLTTCSES
jgi:hypothetical protein